MQSLQADWQKLADRRYKSLDQLMAKAQPILNRACQWALAEVKRHPDRYPDPGNPPMGEQTSQDSLTMNAAGCTSTVEAGRRVTYWLAVIADPYAVDRDPGDVSSLRAWLWRVALWQDGEHYRARYRWLAWLGECPTEPVGELQYVTRDQIALIVGRSKDWVAHQLNTDDESPEPDVEGGGGKRHEYLWHEVRHFFEKKTGKTLPERFPSLIPPS